jgi:hypothetical protein
VVHHVCSCSRDHRHGGSPVMRRLLAEAPTRIELEEPKVLLPETKEMAEAPSTEEMEKAKRFTEGSKISEVLSPSTNVESIKNQKGPAVTLKRKRMVTVLDVLETIESSNTTPKKTAETSEAPRQQAETDTGLSKPTKEEKISEPIPVEEISAVAPEASPAVPDYIVRHASGKKLSEKEKQEAQFYAQKLKYPKGALIFNGSGEEDFLYCLPDSKEISVCREISKSFGFPTLEDGLSVLSKDESADSLAYNSLKVQNLRPSDFLLKSKFSVCLNVLTHTHLSLQGLILSNALRAQKDAEDEGCAIALSNLRSEVIELRNEGLEKDKILHSLVNRIKEDEATFKSQAEAQKLEIEDLRRQLARAKEERMLEETRREISDQWANHLEGTVEELRSSKKRCYNKSMDCVKKLKASFTSVGAFSSEENFTIGNPEGPIEWISHEAEAFEEILNSRGDICAFSGARGIATILEKKGCEHVKILAQSKATLLSEDTKDPSAEASMVGGKFFTDIWDNGGREMAREIIQRSEKGIHEARKIAEAAEKSTGSEGQIGIN